MPRGGPLAKDGRPAVLPPPPPKYGTVTFSTKPSLTSCSAGSGKSRSVPEEASPFLATPGAWVLTEVAEAGWVTAGHLRSEGRSGGREGNEWTWSSRATCRRHWP